MTGLMGKGNGLINAVDTGKLLSQVNPTGVSSLSTVVMPGTELFDKAQKGEFIEATEYERIVELKTLAENIFYQQPTKFNSVHVSNAVAVRAMFPQDKEGLIKALDEFLLSTNEEEFDFDRSQAIRHH